MSIVGQTIVLVLGPVSHEYAVDNFFGRLRSIIKSQPSNVVLDLRSLRKSPGLAFGELLEEAWLTLTENRKGMAIVVNEGIVDSFRSYTFARSPIAISIDEAKVLATAPVVHQSLDHELCIQLERIEIRFRELVQQRIGHLWDDGEPPYPPVLRLYQCGVRKGHFAFPYGNYSWRVVNTVSGIMLKYTDDARIADGWGCSYEISCDGLSLREGLGTKEIENL
ncbi:MAG: hypothetical protein R3C09_23480 [Pirellulaceae bacterium]